MRNTEMPGVRVLLVDDEEAFVSVLTERLIIRGMQAHYVCSADEAIQYIKDNPTDVMFLDIKMPGMDGNTACEVIKRLKPSLDVIIMSGQIATDSTSEKTRSLAFDYLIKPVGINDIIACINQVLSKEKTP